MRISNLWMYLSFSFPALYGMLFGRRRLELAKRAYANFRELNCPIPVISLECLSGMSGVQNTPSVTIHPGESGVVTFFETLLMSMILKRLNPRAVLEIGTFRGRTTWHLLNNTPSECNVYTIDFPENETPDDVTDMILARNKERPYLVPTERLHPISVDTRKWDGGLPEKVNFAFIDGDHSFAGVKNDTDKVMSVLDDVACVCWHDGFSYRSGYGTGRYLASLYISGMPLFRVSSRFEWSSLVFFMTPCCLGLFGLTKESFQSNAACKR